MYIDRKKVYYQYHYLFRQFLLSHAQGELDPQTLKDARLKAADILLNNGQVAAAAEIFKKTRNWTKLAPVIVREAPQLLREGRNRVVEGWLQSLPEEMLEANPWLVYYKGLSRLPFNPTESTGYFERAYKAFRALNDWIGMIRGICGVLNAISIERKDYLRGVRWIETLEELLREKHEPLPRELEGQVTSSVFYLLSLVKPNHPDFDLWKRRARRIIEEPGDLHLRMLVGNNLIIYYVWIGDLASAAMVLDIMRRLSVTNKASPFIVARKISAEQAYYLFAGLYEECLRVGEEGVEHARRTGVAIWEGQYHAVNASPAISYGDFEEAQRLLDCMSDHSRDEGLVNNMDLAFYHCFKDAISPLRRGTFLFPDRTLRRGWSAPVTGGYLYGAGQPDRNGTGTS